MFNDNMANAGSTLLSISGSSKFIPKQNQLVNEPIKPVLSTVCAAETLNPFWYFKHSGDNGDIKDDIKLYHHDSMGNWITIDPKDGTISETDSPWSHFYRKSSWSFPV